MEPGPALERVREDVGNNLRAFVTVHPDRVTVEYARPDVERALQGATLDGHDEARLRRVAETLLAPGETATVRYTRDEIVVGLPDADDANTGYLISLDHDASPTVDEFIEVLLEQGATIRETRDSDTPGVSRNGHSAGD